MANSLSKNISDGWHGSKTRIKIMPRDFFLNDDWVRDPAVRATTDPAKSGGLPFGIDVSNAALEIYACIPIPTGYKATGMKIAGTDTANEVWAWEACVVGCGLIPLFDTSETKNVGTEYDFNGSANNPSLGADSMTAGVTNYLLIWVETEAIGDSVYGGYVNIERT